MADSPVSGIPVIGAVVSVLQTIFGVTDNTAAINTLESVAQHEWENQINTASFAYGLFGGVLGSVRAIILKVGAALAHVIHDILHGHLLHLLQDILALLHQLRNAIAPLIKWLQQLQKIQRQYQLQTLKHAIDLIQRIRKVLVVFRLFHFKFAQKLDNWLLNVEGKLIGGVFNMARKTNEILGWVNVLADPLGFHNSKWLFGSIARDMSAIAAAARALGLKQMFPGQVNQTWSAAPASPAGPVKQIGV